MPFVNRGIRGPKARRDKWRLELLEAQGWKCSLCGEALDLNEATFDHAVPAVRGGTNKLPNLTVAHRLCNNDKGDKIIQYKVIPDSLGVGLVMKEIGKDAVRKQRKAS